MRSIDYILIGPLGSRSAMLTAYRHKGKIILGTGCFLGTIKEFEMAVDNTHGDNEHGKMYRSALAYIHAMFD